MVICIGTKDSQSSYDFTHLIICTFSFKFYKIIILLISFELTFL